jgi:hypothetical protein
LELYRDANPAHNVIAGKHDLIRCRLMFRRFWTDTFHRPGDALASIHVRKKILAALLATILFFGAGLSAFASPAMVDCDGFMQMSTAATGSHPARDNFAQGLPCGCTTHDCATAACCGLVAGLPPTEAFVAPAGDTTEAAQMPQADIRDVSLPPALPPPIVRC